MSLIDELLYPHIEPYRTGFLQVSDVHNLYFEESGNPNGKPIVVVHGGPGSGTEAWNRRFFNPDRYRIIMFDQRGAGKSTPHADLTDNTTWHLVADIQRLKTHLEVSGKWVVFGGSWGSTLALAYAISHPEEVGALILRGIFLCRRKEVAWMYQEGASYMFPEEFDRYVSIIPEDERHDLVTAFNRRLTSDDEEARLQAARAWARWEMATNRLQVDPANVLKAEQNNHFALAFARIENHYFLNGGFFETPDWIIENAHKLKGIPGTIYQGRYDMVCPAVTAYELSKAWPEGEYQIAKDAGHSFKEPSLMRLVFEACEKYSF